MNILSAKLLQDAVQNTTQQIQQRHATDLAAQEAMQRNAIEEASRQVNEARYNAQQQHWTATEAAQAEAATKAQQNQEKIIQQNREKWDLDKGIAQLSAAREEGRAAGFTLNNGLIGMARDGADAPTIAASLKGSLDMKPEFRDDILSQNPNLGIMLKGTFDPAKLAALPFVNVKTGAPSEGGAGMGGKGVEGVHAEALRLGNEAQAKTAAAQQELSQGQSDDETDEDWAARQAQLTGDIKSATNEASMHMAYAKRLEGLGPSKNTTTTTVRPNTWTGAPMTTTSSQTSSFGAPEAPAGPSSPPAAAGTPTGAPAPRPASLTQPVTPPNLSSPVLQPSAAVAPGVTPPAMPNTVPPGSGGMIRVVHPNGKTGSIPATNWPAAQAQGYMLAQ